MGVKSIGVDAGSTVVKIVGIDDFGKIALYRMEQADPQIEIQVDRMMDEIKQEYNFKDIPIVATGYGSELIKNAAKRVTEITCHARGAFEYFKKGGTLLDIGGQDSKVIVIAQNGHIVDFIMNDKCAAGTGRFLETSAWRLKIPMEKMGEIALSSDKETPISSTCAVFAESEVISRLAHGEKLEDVIRGLHRSLVKRIAAMVYAIGFTPPLMLSGGVVLNRAIRIMIEEEMGTKALLPEHPQLMGAYGAAFEGLDSA